MSYNYNVALCLLILRWLNTAITTVKVKRCVEGMELMYDLTIENHACYQANGVLVSNSDSFRTFAVGFQPKAKKRKSVSQMMDTKKMAR